MASSQLKIRTPGEAVARIAYLSSDIIISVQPTIGTDSEFSSHLRRYADRQDKGYVANTVPEIVSVRHNADPLLTVFSHLHNRKLVSVTTTSSILVPSISHLHKLAQFPVVLHVSLFPPGFPDYSAITSIRSTGFTLLQSESLQEAQDIALTAHALATRSSRGVIHFFDSGSSIQDSHILFENMNLVKTLLDHDTVITSHANRGSERISVDDKKSSTVTEATESSSAVIHNTMNSQIEEPVTNTLPNAFSIYSNDSSPEISENRKLSVSAEKVTELLTERAVTSDDIYTFLVAIWKSFQEILGREYSPFHFYGPLNAESAIFVFGSDVRTLVRELDSAKSKDIYPKAGIISVRLYRPWIGSKLVAQTPSSVRRIAVLEQIRRKTTKWGPFLLDILTTFQSGSGSNVDAIVGYLLGYIAPETARQALLGVIQNLRLSNPVQCLEVGSNSGPSWSEATYHLSQPKIEFAYMKALNQVFGQRLLVANTGNSQGLGISPIMKLSPEFGFGALIARKHLQQEFIDEVKQAAASKKFATEVPSRWLAKWYPGISEEVVEGILARLETDGSSLSRSLLSKKGLFRKESHWLIASDAWAHDLGNSGFHHVIASGENINMLIIDSTPYSGRAAIDTEQRKKDIGLYAMNYGNVYVASVAVYSSYTQTLKAFLEADRFHGPSIILAYLPHTREDESSLTILRETKKAVSIGHWPLYRWNPENTGNNEPSFSLDSNYIEQELDKSLAHENHLTLLIKKYPKISSAMWYDCAKEKQNIQKKTTEGLHRKLLQGISGSPLTILYSSDNEHTEVLAKQFGNRGRSRGLKPTLMTLENYPIEDLPDEENIIIFTNTGGQGELSESGHFFWNTIKQNTELDLASVNYSIFALGDSQYWPHMEDRQLYRESGNDLDQILADLGGKRLAQVGLAVDRDFDGYETGYWAWEPLIWRALGVDKLEDIEEAPHLANEDVKLSSKFLRGTIKDSLEDLRTSSFSAMDRQLLKFHGVYSQENRNLQEGRKALGHELAYSFTVQCRLSGGVATPSQWIQMDDISKNYGDGTIRLTMRQTFQLNDIAKSKLKSTLRSINDAFLTTIACGGDVNRNVMCSSLPTAARFQKQVHAISTKISDHLLPSTTAYDEIWLKDEDSKTLIARDTARNFEPLYGPAYLPHNFKIGIAVPPYNDVDVYAQDIGLIACKGKSKSLIGFNVLVGGGMSISQSKKTYPRTGSMLGFVPKEEAHIVCEKVMLVQRDHGNRIDRKRAFLKYTIDSMGVDVFKYKVEALWGKRFKEPKAFIFQSHIDTFGWQKDEIGLHHFTLFIENGRVSDMPNLLMKTALREIAKVHKGEFRLTANQNLIISNVSDAELITMKDILVKYKLDNAQTSGLRLSSLACVALPTCGLALAEAERYLPTIISKLEGTVGAVGLRRDSIVMRMAGCPIGCSRPWLAEVAFVGQAPGTYNMYLGGGYHGQRLNKLYRSNIKEEEILDLMKPLLRRYAQERDDDEHFGDFCIRAGIVKETLDGKTFHNRVMEVEYDF
ncbi:Sulfite reductase [NADPH] subunit beta [Podosphaera aphanis]|nr:Sulfite reductase [NADPH] subunit beta [Podosphaera aphanis]